MAGEKRAGSSSEGTPATKKLKLASPSSEVEAKSANKKEGSKVIPPDEETFPAVQKLLTPLNVKAKQDLQEESGDEEETKQQSKKTTKPGGARTNASKRYMSVDVECVATGRRHDDREVCSVSVVDGESKVLLSKKVKPEKPVVSYLTPISGVGKGDLNDCERLADVIAQVKALLGGDVVLVGQGIKSDIEWMKLQKGVDYLEFVDLGEMFKAYNQRYGNYSFFSLSHEANTLIRPGFISEPHNPDIDAIASIQLFNMYHGKPRELEQAKKRLMSVRPPMSFAKRNNYRYEGVCMAAFFPAKCFCGAPTKKS